MEKTSMGDAQVPCQPVVTESSLSPSLVVMGEAPAPAYEIKFFLSESRAQELLQRASAFMVPDIHANPNAGNSYQTTSLYFDTENLAVFHRLPGHRRKKYRIRRYGVDGDIFLEEKERWGDRVRKQRVPAKQSDLKRLLDATRIADWHGSWFQSLLHAKQLAPVCLINYNRVALVGDSPTGPIRLTMDRRIQGVLCQQLCLDFEQSTMPILADGVLCELKYRTAVPGVFKEIIESMRLIPQPVSKYRTFLQAKKSITGKEFPYG